MTAPAGPAPTVTCPVTTLVPDDTTTCTATYTVTQADVNNGSVRNSATASGTTPAGGTVTSPPSVATVTTAQTPGIQIVKSATPTTVTAAGQTIAYSFRVTNTGNITLTDVTVDDTQTAPAGPSPAVTCPTAPVAPNATITCTASYTVTQADVDNGTIRNSATATGTEPDGSTLTSTPSVATVTATQTQSITIAKTATPTTVTAAGQTVAYSFLVTNTGNTTLNEVGVTDTFTAPAAPELTVACPVTTLAPQTSTTCTASYTVTQADMNRGRIDNSAIAAGTGPAGPEISPASTASVTATQSPALTVTKSVTPTTVTAAGQQVAYSFVVRNTGNVSLINVSVADTLTAPAGPALSVTCPTTTLTPNTVMTCTATYVVTQADVNNGSIRNTATASGTTRIGTPVTSPPSSATVTADREPSISVTKSVTPTTVTAANQAVAYSFLVRNTGNTTLTDVALTDTLTPPAGPELAITCPQTTLAPNATMTCTAPYVATQADIDNGSIANSVIADGVSPTGPVTSDPSTATVTATPAPRITIVKTANPTTVTAAGQQVAYSFAVRNTGNVTLTGVTVDDTLTAPAGPALTVTCPTTPLAPNATTTCTATYTTTQADIDNGTIQNSATATGTTPTGGTTTSQPSTATVNATADPELTIVKTADPTAVTAAGQQVAYSFAVRNTGNVTLTDVHIDDTLTAPAGPAMTVTCPVTTLAPTAGTTCTATYTTTQADIDNGAIRNSATATGTTPAGGTTTSPPSTATVTAAPTPGITVAKTADPTTVTAAGDTVDYEFLVTNTGNVTLTSITINDTFTAPAAPAPTVTCPVTTLAPAAVTTCTASYTATQADIDNGTIRNTATATGTTPAGTTTTSPPSTATVTATPAPALTVAKTADPTEVTKAGDTVAYSFRVTNTGNVTLTGVGVNDTLDDPATPALIVTCPQTTLAPDAFTTCTASYTATQADIDNGTIRNTATATGTTPAGQTTTSPPSSATVTATQAPALTVVKSADPTVIDGAGDIIGYEFEVTNTGNVTLTDVHIDDILTAPAGPALTVTCPVTTLAPAAGTICTAPYVATQADVDNGSIRNTATATATGTPPAGGEVISPPSSTTTVTANQAPGISVEKSASPTSARQVGVLITYSFVVRNTGNVTLYDISIDDTLTAPAGPALTVTCPVTTLAPATDATCTATYTVTQDDMDNGSVQNSATASGATSPGGPVVPSDPSTATVLTEPAPAIALVKSGSTAADTNGDGIIGPGDQLTYAFQATNTGNVTLRNVTIDDAKLGLVDFPCGTAILAVGEIRNCGSATYTLTQADVDAGQVVNRAVVAAVPPPNGCRDDSAEPCGPVNDEDEVTTPVPGSPGLALEKSASKIADTDGNDRVSPGDTITYSFVVTNTGTVSLTDIVVSDPKLAMDEVACGSAPLAPGDSRTCPTERYRITAADIDAGKIVNAAVATATPPDGPPISTADKITTPVRRSPLPQLPTLPDTGALVGPGFIALTLGLLGSGVGLLLAGARRRRPDGR